MNVLNPSSPKTPPRKHVFRKHDGSPSFMGSPGCCSTPSTSKKSKGSTSSPKVLWDKDKSSPSKHKVLGSPLSLSQLSFRTQESRCRKQSVSKEMESDMSGSFSRHASSTDPSWGVTTYSSTESNGTVTVELDFPHGGWDEGEDSSDASSTCSLEIVESEVECKSISPRRGRKRKQSEVSEEDSAILSGMGEEIERQLEAKAERNRLTVPNVKNILRSVITNPYVQAMVRRSIKSGDVAVSGDTDDMSFEPRMTRAKAKLLCDNSDPKLYDVAWAATPHKAPPTSECQALINEELNYDSDDDEEYHPGEEEPSDNEYSERDGSERDISLEQSPACFDTDTESCPATPSPSPKPPITDSSTQTNWSEDGVFKVPLLPPEQPFDHTKEENIALRTRSKLPLNDTPLEEIEQAFIPPDITPDLYDTTCDNADWQEFLKEFMQPMRSEPETQNHDDEEEDPEYNVLAEEEIIDREELRMDRAVKVSKRELNELMRELLEFTENMSSDDEDKGGNKDKGASLSNISPGQSNSTNDLANHEDMSLFLDAYMSYGTLGSTSGQKSTPPPNRSPSTPTLHTPVPPFSPPCRTPGTAKKEIPSEVSYSGHCNGGVSSNSGGKGKTIYPHSGKKQTPGKVDSFQNSAGSSKGGQNHASSHATGRFGGKTHSSGKPDIFQNSLDESQGEPKQIRASNQLEKCSNTGRKASKAVDHHTPGKFDIYQISCSSPSGSGLACDDESSTGLSITNVAVRSGTINTDKSFFTPGKEYLLLSSNQEKDAGNAAGAVLEFQDNEDNEWSSCNDQHGSVLEPTDRNADESDSESSDSVTVEDSPVNCDESESFSTGCNVNLNSNGDVTVNNVIVLSAAQRLLLDQQMREYVQLTTQHFLQSYQHPVHNMYAETCKKQLVSLNLKARNKQNSAFRAANLLPALDVINRWEEKLSSEEGAEIKRFMEQQVLEAKHMKSRKQKHIEKFSPQLMELVSSSTVFFNPKLLPHIPFRTIFNPLMMLPSEVALLAIGLEEFTQFITENDPACKGRCLRRALDYIAEYLLVGRDSTRLCHYVRRMKKPEGPIKHFFEHKCAPPTSHYVYRFTEEQLMLLKEQPSHKLPAVWRDFVYPAVE